MKRVVAGLWMLLWIGLMGWFALWMIGEGRWLMGHKWPFMGLAVALVGFLVLFVCGRGLWLVVQLLLGRTTPRLARRDFRNSLSNLAMFAKTGFWKW